LTPGYYLFLGSHLQIVYLLFYTAIFVRRNNWAFTATITVLRDIKMAPTAGESRNPKGARMPAASGKATTL
jgi:hypothetical protein